MSTHFRSGPAFGLSAEVKSKVSHRSDVVPRFCQALKLTYLKINQNRIRVVYTRFLLYLMAEKNIFVIFLKGSYHESQEHFANKRQQKNPHLFFPNVVIFAGLAW